MTFSNVVTLDPEASVTNTIVTKALNVGDARLKVEVTTHIRTHTIEETELTTIY